MFAQTEVRCNYFWPIDQSGTRYMYLQGRPLNCLRLSRFCGHCANEERQNRGLRILFLWRGMTTTASQTLFWRGSSSLYKEGKNRLPLYYNGNVRPSLQPQKTSASSATSAVLILKVFAACDDFDSKERPPACAFPCVLCAPCVLCGEGFWLRLRRAAFQGLGSCS